jgi:hypothetical protein
VLRLDARERLAAKGSRTRRCQGCNHVERVRIERFLAAGANRAVAFSVQLCYSLSLWVVGWTGPPGQGWSQPERQML